jgi:hypothetical protein
VTGTDPLKSHLVTTGLFLPSTGTNPRVVAHEMGHTANLDMQLMTLVAGSWAPSR